MDGTLQATRKLRCAIYTRKSTENGLEQEFNTHSICLRASGATPSERPARPISPASGPKAGSLCASITTMAGSPRAMTSKPTHHVPQVETNLLHENSQNLRSDLPKFYEQPPLMSSAGSCLLLSDAILLPCKSGGAKHVLQDRSKPHEYHQPNEFFPFHFPFWFVWLSPSD